MPASPLLEVVDVSASYRDVDILRGVSLRVEPGEVVALVGPNGAGKSTLLKVVVGLLAPRRGRVRLDGIDVAGEAPETLVRRGVGYVPQVANVFPSLTVRENLRLGLRPRRAGEAAEAEVLALFPVLRDRLGLRAGALSGGERQMLALGRALALRPRLLLLDEPSAALAPRAAAAVFERLVEINRRGVALLLVEQNARRALALAHRGYVLEQGRVALEAAGPALRQDPRVAALYLGGHAAVTVEDDAG